MERLERTPSTRGFVAQLPYERDFTKTERRPVCPQLSTRQAPNLFGLNCAASDLRSYFAASLRYDRLDR